MFYYSLGYLFGAFWAGLFEAGAVGLVGFIPDFYVLVTELKVFPEL